MASASASAIAELPVVGADVLELLELLDVDEAPDAADEAEPADAAALVETKSLIAPIVPIDMLF